MNSHTRTHSDGIELIGLNVCRFACASIRLGHNKIPRSDYNRFKMHWSLAALVQSIREHKCNV